VAIDNIITAATNFSPLLTTVGFGGLVGFLLGFVMKKLFKILAIIAGVFFAVLMYLEQQGIVNINWDKINVAYHGVLSTLVNTVNSTSATTEGTAATSHLLPTTMTLTNLGIPLTGSTAVGFAIGIMKG
jgi:uncharacterized membrane protein (Fun14 family)